MSQMQIDQVLAQIRSLAPSTLPRSPAQVAPANGNDFAALLRRGVDGVNQTQQRAEQLASAYQRGDSGVDLAQVMLESQKASVSFRALTEVRNRLVNVYQEIMNMPI